VDVAQTDLMELLNANSYQKGGYVLHMLRQVVGDSAWIRGVRAYYAAHRHGNATTDDLRASMEQAHGSDLRWFFDQWLTRPGYPELNATWEHGEGLTIIIRQAGRFGPYRLRLPVQITAADGTVTNAIVEVPATPTVRITIPGRFTSRPQSVVFDPGGDLLAVITTN
jgi:aminopeptidase N